MILASWSIYAGGEPSNLRSSSVGTTLQRIKYIEELGGRANSYICTRIMLARICQHGAPRVPEQFRVSPRPIHARLRLRLDALGIVGSFVVPHLPLPFDNVLLLFTAITTNTCFRGSHNWHAIFLVLYPTTLILLLLQLPVLPGES